MSGSDSDSEIDIDEGISQINNLIVKNIFNYLKTGKFNNKTKEAYIAAYTIVYKLTESNENEYSKKLYDFYNDNISNYMAERCNFLKVKTEQDFIFNFIEETNKCNILIHWMRKVFCYLDKFSNRNNKLPNLFTTGLKLYKQIFYKSLEDLIINAINEYFNQHRNGVNVDIKNIKDVITIMTYVDFKKPVLNKNSDGELFWTGEFSGKELDLWFDSFIISTNYYTNNKANKEINSLSGPEYITRCLTYFNEEDERKNMFIDRKYHSKIDKVNIKNLIDNNCKQLDQVSFIIFE